MKYSNLSKRYFAIRVATPMMDFAIIVSINVIGTIGVGVAAIIRRDTD